MDNGNPAKKKSGMLIIQKTMRSKVDETRQPTVEGIPIYNSYRYLGVEITSSMRLETKLTKQFGDCLKAMKNIPKATNMSVRERCQIH